MLELAPRESELVRGRESEAAVAPAAPVCRWRPLEDPLAVTTPRRRGLIANLTAFFIAYHTA